MNQPNPMQQQGSMNQPNQQQFNPMQQQSGNHWRTS
jgi:hypothetical protein